MQPMIFIGGHSVTEAMDVNYGHFPKANSNLSIYPIQIVLNLKKLSNCMFQKHDVSTEAMCHSKGFRMFPRLGCPYLCLSTSPFINMKMLSL